MWRENKKTKKKNVPLPPQKKQNKHNKERNKACDEPDEKNMNWKKKNGRPTTLGIPRRSPIQVLTEP